MKLSTKLKKLKGQSGLKDYVINYILDQYEDNQEIECFFSDLANSGCQSGMISGLIYYSETQSFYLAYQDEIEELVENFEDLLGEAIMVKGNRLNFYAWFAFEETARNLANLIGLEY